MQSSPSPKPRKRARLHVGIIMDGNGRWGIGRGMPRAQGHEAGAEAVRRIVKAAVEEGLGTLTLFAMSSDNFRRPKPEVALLLHLVSRYLTEEREALVEAGLRLTIIGRRDRLPTRMVRVIEATEAATTSASGLHLRIALDYSGRDAILAAAARIASGAGLTRQDFSRLVAGDCPDVDLLIRTGGEQRLSDFLLWESAYAELYFTQRMWPDFGAEDLRAALADFSQRNRRFGDVAAHAA